MQSTGLNKGNLALEKGRTPIMLLGGISAFVFVLTYLYLIAIYVMDYEFGLYPYDYIPFINIINVRRPLIWFIFLPLALNSSAVLKVETRVGALICLLLSIILKAILLEGTSHIWVWAVLSMANLFLEIIFLGLTFKANKFMNALIIFSAVVRLGNVAFVLLNYYLSLSGYIPFSAYYIHTGVGLLFYAFMTLYLFALTTRSKDVKKNMSQWETEKAQATSTLKPPVTAGPANRTISPQPESRYETAKTAPVPIQGDETYGIPRPAFWCPHCKQQKKVALTKDNMYIQNKCPQCGNTILAWWNKSPKSKFNRFIAGLVLMAGGMFTIMIENVLNEGYIPVIIMMVIGIIYWVLSLALFLPAIKFTVDGPAPEAASVLPQGIFERFLPEMLKVVLIALFGGLILFGIARIILVIIMGVF